MRRILFLKLFLLCLFVTNKNLTNRLLAISIDADSISIKKCQNFKVTGDGRSENWKNTEWINLVPQGPNPFEYQTSVKVLYSETGIYFLFYCKDNRLTSTMKADNLNLFEEDVVEVFLWPNESIPIYFEYELSPLNKELPLIVPNDKGTFYGWLPWRYVGDRKTQHATSVVKNKSRSIISDWMAEFYIPYKLLAPLRNVPPMAGTKWRANMYRIDYDNGVTYFVWQKIIKSFHEYNNFGTFIFD